MRCAWNCSVVAYNGVMSSDAYLQGVLNVLRGHTHACAWTHDQVLFRTLRSPALRLLRACSLLVYLAPLILLSFVNTTGPQQHQSYQAIISFCSSSTRPS